MKLKYFFDTNLKVIGGKIFKRLDWLKKMNTNTEIKQFDLLINGELKSASDDKTFESINPSTGEICARLADASSEDARSAISAAREAFDNGSWSGLSIAERGIFLKGIAKLIRDNAKELAELETSDVGKTTKQATFIDVPTCADTFDYFSNISTQLNAKDVKVDQPVKALVEREPLGVVVCIIPWNYPLIMAAWKMAPALIAGNTIVFKPSSTASASVMRLAQIIEQAQLPKGVVNIISTSSGEVASEILKSKDIDLITFTGGTETGKFVVEQAAKNIKRTTMELGGKSPNIVLADCDKDCAIGGTLSAIFMNQGQMCTAGSRLLIEDKIYDEFLSDLVARAKSLKIGDAARHDTDFGPIVSQAHRDYILTMINDAVKAGATLECGGKIPEGMDKGFYLEPTILSNVDASMDIVKEEVFGPVLVVMKFRDVEEAIKIANDCKYGLASCVWTKNEEKAKIIAKKLQCGTVWINTYGGFYNETPFGGYKQSGYGRELGLDGLLEYTQTKTIMIDQTPGGKSLVSCWF